MQNEKQQELINRAVKILPKQSIDQVEINQEGLVNDIVIVNRQWVVRFAKNQNAAIILSGETKILNLIQSRVQVSLPVPIIIGDDFVVYPYLNGAPCLREIIKNLTDEAQVTLANQLGSFLSSLHQTPIENLDWTIPPTLAPVTHEKWLNIRQRVTDKIYPHLLTHQISWTEKLFEQFLSNPAFFDYTPALIHGDLAPYHILINNNMFSGILDFGVSGIGDPASDIGALITYYGETFVTKLSQAYPNLEKFLPRARFYAQSIELQWVLWGLETKQDFWFTAHLGNARDILSD